MRGAGISKQGLQNNFHKCVWGFTRKYGSSEEKESLNREIETIKENQLEILELKNKIPEMKKKITGWT